MSFALLVPSVSFLDWLCTHKSGQECHSFTVEPPHSCNVTWCFDLDIKWTSATRLQLFFISQHAARQAIRPHSTNIVKPDFILQTRSKSFSISGILLKSCQHTLCSCDEVADCHTVSVQHQLLARVHFECLHHPGKLWSCTESLWLLYAPKFWNPMDVAFPGCIALSRLFFPCSSSSSHPPNCAPLVWFSGNSCLVYPAMDESSTAYPFFFITNTQVIDEVAVPH